MKTMQKLMVTMLAWCMVAGLALIACSNDGTPKAPTYKITLEYDDSEGNYVLVETDNGELSEPGGTLSVKKGASVTVTISPDLPDWGLLAEDGVIVINDKTKAEEAAEVECSETANEYVYTFVMENKDITIAVEFTDDEDLMMEWKKPTPGKQPGGKDPEEGEDPDDKKPATNDLIIYDNGLKGGYTDGYETNGWKVGSYDALDIKPAATGMAANGARAYEVGITKVYEWFYLHITADTPVNFRQYKALSFQIKADQPFTLGSVGWGDRMEADPAAVAYAGNRTLVGDKYEFSGIPITTTWQTIIVPIPNPAITGTNTTTSNVFSLVGYPGELEGKKFWLDDIRYIADPDATKYKLNTIALVRNTVNLTHKSSSSIYDAKLFTRYLTLNYLTPGSSVTTTPIYGADGNIDLAYWFGDGLDYTGAGTGAALTDGSLVTSGAGTFNLQMQIGTLSTPNLAITIRESLPPNDNGWPLDVPWTTTGNGPDWMGPALPATRPTPTPGMIDDFLYAKATLTPVIGSGPGTDQALLAAPYWYGSTDRMGDGGGLGDGQCWTVNGTPAIDIFFDAVNEGEWISIGRTGLLYDIHQYTTINFMAKIAAPDNPGDSVDQNAKFTFSLQSGDEELGTVKSASYEFSPVYNTGGEISIPLTTFADIDLYEITAYTFSLVPPSVGGNVYIYQSIVCR